MGAGHDGISDVLLRNTVDGSWQMNLMDINRTDDDNYGIENSSDNCPNTPNPEQTDSDGDGVVNACNNCPDTHNTDQTDADLAQAQADLSQCSSDLNQCESDLDQYLIHLNQKAKDRPVMKALTMMVTVILIVQTQDVISVVSNR